MSKIYVALKEEVQTAILLLTYHAQLLKIR